MKREYTDYINDIYDSIKKIEKFTEHMKFAQFEGDDKTILAVVKALEIIGEAVKKIPASIKGGMGSNLYIVHWHLKKSEYTGCIVRPLKIHFPDAFYYIACRGIERR